jgi:SAM-dependent methyltransferase
MDSMSTVNDREWFKTALGQHLLEREQAYFDDTVSDIFGFNALQLGLTQFDFLRANRIPLRAALGEGPNVRAVADLNFLPIASQSIDLLLLPHVLEFASHPHQILREVERVLMPEGHVVIAGFNPLSLWGVKRFVNRRSGNYPWTGHFISLPRVKDWLALLNFEVTGGRLCCYSPPIASLKWSERLRFMEEAGDRWWPLGGGVYFLVAKKRVHGMRLIMPSWNERLAAKQRLAAAAQRQVANLHKNKERDPVV